MTEQLQYFAKVSADGDLTGLPRMNLRKELKRLFAGKSIEILIHKKKKFRTIQQNRTHWMYCTMVSEVTGYTKDEVHSIAKSLFLQAEKVNEKTGTVFSYTKSTTELSTTEYMEFTEQFKQWAAEEFGIVLPDPGEQMDFEVHQLNETV